MSKLLLKMDQRSKRTELMVTELRNQRAVGVLPTVANLHLLEDELPVMPFTDWNELLKFEHLLVSVLHGKVCQFSIMSKSSSLLISPSIM